MSQQGAQEWNMGNWTELNFARAFKQERFSLMTD